MVLKTQRTDLIFQFRATETFAKDKQSATTLDKHAAESLDQGSEVFLWSETADAQYNGWPAVPKPRMVWRCLSLPSNFWRERRIVNCHDLHVRRYVDNGGDVF